MKSPATILSFILTVSLLFALISCSSDEEEVFNGAFEESSGTVDLGGQRIYLMSGWIDEWLPDVGYTVAGDNLRTHYANIEKKLNCKFQLDYLANTSIANEVLVLTAVASEDIPDIIDYHVYDIYSLYEADLLFSYDDISTIDLTDEKWGNANFIRYGSFAGKQYGTFTYNWQWVPQLLGTCIFDAVTVKTLGLTNPQELYESGKWTRSEFENMLKLASFTDENNVNHYGVTPDSMQCLMLAALFSNGGEVVEEQNGSYKCALGSKQALQSYEWIASLNNAGYIGDFSYDNFCADYDLFYVGESHKFTVMSTGQEANAVYNHQGYGFIPFPAGEYGDYDESGDYICCGRRLNWICKYGSMDKDELGLFLDELYNPFSDTEERAWIKYLEDNIFHFGKEDSKIFVQSVENVHYDWSSEIYGIYNEIYAGLASVGNGKKTPAEFISSIEGTVNNALSEIEYEK